VSWLVLPRLWPTPLIVRLPCLWLIYLDIFYLVTLQQEKSPSPDEAQGSIRRGPQRIDLADGPKRR
jgi:hypothetical protein